MAQGVERRVRFIRATDVVFPKHPWWRDGNVQEFATAGLFSRKLLVDNSLR
jgi:hypothetical protein